MVEVRNGEGTLIFRCDGIFEREFKSQIVDPSNFESVTTKNNTITFIPKKDLQMPTGVGLVVFLWKDYKITVK